MGAVLKPTLGYYFKAAARLRKEDIMKFTALLVVIAMLLSISLTLVSCGGGTDGGDDTGEVGGGENGGGNTGGNGGNTDGDGGNTGDGNEGGNTGNEGGGENDGPSDYETLPVTVVEKYLPEALSSAIYTQFESKDSIFRKLTLASGPFAYADVFGVSNGTLKSITVPVRSTEAPNASGKFTMTIVKVKNTTKGISGSPLATYVIEIDPDEYGLQAKKTASVYKKIVIDLTSYNIVLGADETVAIGKLGDSIVPAMLNHDDTSKEPLKSINDTFPQALGIFRMVGTGNGQAKCNESSICFDFEIERTYESQAAIDKLLTEETYYQSAIAALKELYRGKKVSVVGDSISTFVGISSNTDYNLTLSTNSAKGEYYPTWDATTSDYTKTYWGKVIKDLEMSLCVNNSMSGAFVTGSEKRPAFPKIATQLHRDNGTASNRADDTNPDVVLVFFGINDIDDKNASVGSLYTMLNTANGKTDEEKIESWFAGVLASLEANGGKPRDKYDYFDEAYALGLYLMMEEYEGVEVYCFTHVWNYTEGLTRAKINSYNRVIKALANYFGATVVDQNGELAEYTESNSYTHTSLREDVAIHPKSSGHALIGKLVLKTMAKKNEIAYND